MLGRTRGRNYYYQSDGSTETLIDERKCAWSECQVVFRPRKHNQIYHTPECCKLATNAKLMQQYYDDKARMSGAMRVCRTPNCNTLLSRYNESKFCAKCESEKETKRTKSILDVLNG